MDTVRESQPTLVDLEREAITVRSEMAAISIRDQVTYDAAVEKRTAATKWLKGAEAFFDPSIADAHNLHKKLLAQKKTVCEPVEAQVRQINSALVGWDREQERRRIEEQRRLEEEARRKAEEERLATAVQLEDQGFDDESVDAFVSAPIVPESVVAPPTYEKSSAVVMRDNYSGEVTHLLQLVKYVAKNPQFIGLLQINQTALNAQARALKETMDIPGVRVVNNKVVATGRG